MTTLSLELRVLSDNQFQGRNNKIIYVFLKEHRIITAACLRPGVFRTNRFHKGSVFAHLSNCVDIYLLWTRRE